MKLTTDLLVVPRSQNAWSYTSTPPIRLPSVVLSQAQGQLYLLLYHILLDLSGKEGSVLIAASYENPDVSFNFCFSNFFLRSAVPTCGRLIGWNRSYMDDDVTDPKPDIQFLFSV